MKGRFGFAIAGLAVAVALAPPVAAAAQARTGDSVVADGATSFFTGIDINVVSGPSGDNPTGHSNVVAGSIGRFPSASITCLSVSGNTAVVAGTLGASPIAIPAFVNTLVDNGPADSGLDMFYAAPIFGPAPTVCPA